MRPRTAERFAVDRLAGRSLDEVRSAETHERRVLDHQDHVRQRGQVCAAGDARTHDSRNLRDLQKMAHHGVVVEDARRAVLPGEDASLVRQVHARRVHEVDDRHVASHGDLLRPQHLLDRLRPPRTCLDRRIVRHDDNLAAAATTDARYDTRPRGRAVVLVERDELADLEKRGAPIEQQSDALACRELALVVLAIDLVAAAAERHARLQVAQFRNQFFEMLAVRNRPGRTAGLIAWHETDAPRTCLLTRSRTIARRRPHSIAARTTCFRGFRGVVWDIFRTAPQRGKSA